jgi:hypothetical protein
MQTRAERIAKRIEAETTRPRLTKGALANWLGISRPALNRRLHGEVEWHYDELENLAGIFGTTIADLVGESDTNGTGDTTDP